MKYVGVVTTGGTIYIPRFMTTFSGIEGLLWLLPRQSDKLECCYY
jgi:hypothetical protein